MPPSIPFLIPSRCRALSYRLHAVAVLTPVEEQSAAICRLFADLRNSVSRFCSSRGCGVFGANRVLGHCFRRRLQQQRRTLPEVADNQVYIENVTRKTHLAISLITAPFVTDKKLPQLRQRQNVTLCKQTLSISVLVSVLIVYRG